MICWEDWGRTEGKKKTTAFSNDQLLWEMLTEGESGVTVFPSTMPWWALRFILLYTNRRLIFGVMSCDITSLRTHIKGTDIDGDKHVNINKYIAAYHW